MRSAVLVLASVSLLAGLAPAGGTEPTPSTTGPVSDAGSVLPTFRRTLPQPPSTLTTFNTIDGSFNSGFYNDVVIDVHGNPVVSYYDDGPSALMLARCHDPACNDLTTTTLDDRGHTGLFTSLVLDGDRPVVSYYDLSRRSVVLARCDDPVCTDVRLITIDADAPELTATALGLTPDGQVLVTYRGGDRSELRLASCPVAACQRPRIETLDGPDVDEDVAMHVDAAGRLTVLYRRDDGLRFLTCVSPSCAAAQRATVDEGPGSGFYPTIVADPDGLPVVAHLDFAHKEVVVVRCGDVACRQRDRTVVEAAPLSGFFADLALGPEGRPRLAFFDEQAEVLVLITCGDRVCGTVRRAVVDASPLAGQHLALAVAADGTPVIAYHAGVGRELRIARCSASGCGNPPETDQPGVGIDVAVDDDGRVVAVYRAPSRGIVRVLRCLDVDCREALLTAADDRADAGGSPAVAVGIAGLPVVVLQALAERDLRVSGCRTERCPFLESHDVVTSGSVGHTPDVISDGGGELVLLHRDESQGRLELLRCSDPRCESPGRITVAATAASGGRAVAAALADGQVAVAFHDDRDGRMRLAVCDVSACRPSVTLANDTLPAPLALAVRAGEHGEEIATIHRDATTGEAVLSLCGVLPCDDVAIVHLAVGAAYPSVAATARGFDVVHADGAAGTVVRRCEDGHCGPPVRVTSVAGPTAAATAPLGTVVAVLDLVSGAPTLARCDSTRCRTLQPEIRPLR